MESIQQALTERTFDPSIESISKGATLQLLHVQDASFMESHDDYEQDRISIYHASHARSINHIQTCPMQIDAVMVGPEQRMAEIGSLKAVADQKGVPLIVYTLAFDQKARDKAVDARVDEYHYGELTYSFVRRVDLIKRIKAHKNQRKTSPVRQSAGKSSTVKCWPLKRTADVIFSLLAVILLSPLFLLIAIMVKVESAGPLFTASRRVGFGYRVFNLYQFRSVKAERKDHLVPSAVGHFLTRTNLVNLPELINVLRGEMSLVGAKPIREAEAEKLTQDQIALRFLVPVGLIGRWNIVPRGKRSLSEDESTSLDIDYALKNSIWLDMKICGLFLIASFTGGSRLRSTSPDIGMEHGFDTPERAVG